MGQLERLTIQREVDSVGNSSWCAAMVHPFGKLDSSILVYLSAWGGRTLPLRI